MEFCPRVHREAPPERFDETEEPFQLSSSAITHFQRLTRLIAKVVVTNIFSKIPI